MIEIQENTYAFYRAKFIESFLPDYHKVIGVESKQFNPLLDRDRFIIESTLSNIYLNVQIFKDTPKYVGYCANLGLLIHIPVHVFYNKNELNYEIYYNGNKNIKQSVKDFPIIKRLKDFM